MNESYLVLKYNMHLFDLFIAHLEDKIELNDAEWAVLAEYINHYFD